MTMRSHGFAFPKEFALMLGHSLVSLALLTAVLAGTAAMAADPPLTYPKTKRIDHIDEYHGTKVPDPYRWLEDDVRKSTDVAKWVEEQNKVTFAYLEKVPERNALKERLTELW